MVCEKGIQILLTTVGAFAAFGLMTVAIGTDYWLYSRALICNSTANVTQDDPHNKDKKDPGALTHSGLWRICCLEGKEEAAGDILGFWVGFGLMGMNLGTSLHWFRPLLLVKWIQLKLQQHSSCYFIAILLLNVNPNLFRLDFLPFRICRELRWSRTNKTERKIKTKGRVQHFGK